MFFHCLFRLLWYVKFFFTVAGKVNTLHLPNCEFLMNSSCPQWTSFIFYGFHSTEKPTIYKDIHLSREASLENAVYYRADPPSDCFMLLVVESGQKAAISTSWTTAAAKAFFNDTHRVLILCCFLHCCHKKDQTELSRSHCKPNGFILICEKTLERDCSVSHAYLRRRKFTCQCSGVITFRKAKRLTTRKTRNTGRRQNEPEELGKNQSGQATSECKLLLVVSPPLRSCQAFPSAAEVSEW